jgi:ABC-type transport system substrate-binding protein
MKKFNIVKVAFLALTILLSACVPATATEAPTATLIPVVVTDPPVPTLVPVNLSGPTGGSTMTRVDSMTRVTASACRRIGSRAPK